MEIWVADSESCIDHASSPGPWSGHRQSLTHDVRVAIDGADFRIALGFRNYHSASNRGRDTIFRCELTGDVAVEPGGARVLRATGRVSERSEYHEPMEDMWTPAIDEVSERPPGPLAEREQVALRVVVEAGVLRVVDVSGARLGPDELVGWLRGARLRPG